MIPVVGRLTFVPFPLVKEFVSLSARFLLCGKERDFSQCLNPLFRPLPFGKGLYFIAGKGLDIQGYYKFLIPASGIPSNNFLFCMPADCVIVLKKIQQYLERPLFPNDIVD